MKKMLSMVAVIWSSFLNAYCFNESGTAYKLDPILLQSIGIKESRLRNSAINNSNSNGSTDYCLMQINSSNMAMFAKINITPERLLKDPCLCVASGAYILAGWVKVYGYTWEAVGAYGAGGSKKKAAARKHYSDDVKAIYTVLNGYYRNQPPSTNGIK